MHAVALCPVQKNVVIQVWFLLLKLCSISYSFYLLPYPFDFGKIKKYEIVLAQSGPRIKRGVQKMQETTLVRDELQSQIHFKKGCFCVRV